MTLTYGLVIAIGLPPGRGLELRFRFRQTHPKSSDSSFSGRGEAELHSKFLRARECRVVMQTLTQLDSLEQGAQAVGNSTGTLRLQPSIGLWRGLGLSNSLPLIGGALTVMSAPVSIWVSGRRGMPELESEPTIARRKSRRVSDLGAIRRGPNPWSCRSCSPSCPRCRTAAITSGLVDFLGGIEHILAAPHLLRVDHGKTASI